jgi:hypothetical protein
MVESTCEGCGMHICNVGRDTVPRHKLCEICRWLSLTADPEELMELRRRCEPGGWISEREQRQKTTQAR